MSGVLNVLGVAHTGGNFYNEWIGNHKPLEIDIHLSLHNACILYIREQICILQSFLHPSRH